MKEFLLIAILVSFSLILNSQSRVLLPKEKDIIRAQMYHSYSESTAKEYQPPSEITHNISFLGPNEHLIGITFYDMQAFNFGPNRMHRYDDGSIGAVWTYGKDYLANFSDRGTGYNIYDGTEWNPIPNNRIESIHTGWPSYAPLGTDGEVVLNGSGNYKLNILTRDVKGIGSWSEKIYTYNSGPYGLVFARMITAGPEHNSIHLTASFPSPYLGQEIGIVYSRSQDAGSSWNIENEVLEGTGADYYVNIWPDQHVWAEERAGTIALLCGGPWIDLFMLKSTDDGETWEKTIIWEHPYPFFDGDFNTPDIFSTDGTASIAIDSEGKAHVVFGITRVNYDNGYNFYPFVDGIGYWNEDMDLLSNNLDALAPPGTGYENSEMIQDYNYIGWMQDVDEDSVITLNSEMFSYRQKGPSTMPSITIDDQDQIFVLYSSTTETFEIESVNYKHIWARAFSNGVWGSFIDLNSSAAHIFDECINPVLASSSDDFIHYYYHADGIPGIAAVDGDHPFQETRIIYGALPKSDLITGIEDNTDRRINPLSVKNYPNPFASVTTLSYILEKPSSVKLSIMNAQGQMIHEITKDQAGGEQQFIWNAQGLPAGLYYYRICIGDQAGSGKMILTK